MQYCLGRIKEPTVFEYYKKDGIFTTIKKDAKPFNTRKEAYDIQRRYRDLQIIPFSKGEFIGG